METHENEPINEILQENQEMCKSNPTSILEKAPSNDQPAMLSVLEYSNVSLIPYKSSLYTQHFQQVAREKKMKFETRNFLSSTIQSILFSLYNNFIFKKALWRQERD